MSQHIINCPKCGFPHEMDAFRNAGVVTAIFSITCKYNTEDKITINKLMGLPEKHRQAMINMEMPIDEGFGRINPRTYGEIIRD